MDHDGSWRVLTGQTLITWPILIGSCSNLALINLRWVSVGSEFIIGPDGSWRNLKDPYMSNFRMELLAGTFRPISSYWPELFQPIFSYWPELFRSISSYWPEPTWFWTFFSFRYRRMYIAKQKIRVGGREGVVAMNHPKIGSDFFIGSDGSWWVLTGLEGFWRVLTCQTLIKI